MSLFEHSVKNILGETTDLAPLKGKVLLIVNVASKCGFTPQYEGLQALQDKFSDKGFTVLGFPCNQFGAQEPGSAEEIADFCTTKFAVKFPLFEKIDVNGENAHPLFRELKKKAPGLLGTEAIKWNFTKFLVSGDGKVIKRFAPKTTPAELEPEIESLIHG